MRYEKQFLTTMNRCYSVQHIAVGGQTRVLLATEGEGACRAWFGPGLADSHEVWAGPGGTMAMVPVPGTDGEFLAVQRFFKMFQWDEARLVHVRPQAGGGYAVSDFWPKPYVHRFDLLPGADGRLHLLACTLAGRKEARDDWSVPGAIWVGEYRGPGEPPTMRLLKDGLTQNHGYARIERDGRAIGLVTCREGAFEVEPPAAPGADWQVRQFMDWPISDIAAIDIDGDGELEYATIEDFHGPFFRVHKKVDGRWRQLWQHPEVSEFYHVAVAATLCGEPVFVGGCRRGRQQLFVVRARSKDPLVLDAERVDEGVGPSNVHVLHHEGQDLIVSANREKAEAALYRVFPG